VDFDLYTLRWTGKVEARTSAHPRDKANKESNDACNLRLRGEQTKVLT